MRMQNADGAMYLSLRTHSCAEVAQSRSISRVSGQHTNQSFQAQSMLFVNQNGRNAPSQQQRSYKEFVLRYLHEIAQESGECVVKLTKLDEWLAVMIPKYMVNTDARANSRMLVVIPATRVAKAASWKVVRNQQTLDRTPSSRRVRAPAHKTALNSHFEARESFPCDSTPCGFQAIPRTP